MEYAELADLLMRRSYLVREPHEDPFVLSSGKTSSHYFDVERTTSYAPAMPLIGQAIYERLQPGVVCVGGPTRGLTRLPTRSPTTQPRWAIPSTPSVSVGTARSTASP